MAKKKNNGYIVPIIGVSDIPLQGKPVTDIKLVQDPTVQIPYEYPESSQLGKRRVPYTIVYEEHAIASGNVSTLNNYDFDITEDVILKAIHVSMICTGTPTYNWFNGIWIQGGTLQRFYIVGADPVNTSSTEEIVLYKGKRIQIYFPTYYTGGRHWFQINFLLQPFR